MVSERTQNAVHETLRTDLAIDGAIALRWVLVVESMTPEGFKTLDQVTSPDTYRWETIGMLHVALADEQAHAVGLIEDDEEDE